MAHLFFSYAHKDYDLIAFQQRLEVISGHKIWIDYLGLERDAKWADMIYRAITSSYGVIFAVTKEFINKTERRFIHQYEIPWATQRFNDERQGKLLFVVRFDDVPLPASLTADNLQFTIHTVDAFNRDWNEVITELMGVFPAATESGEPFMVSWPRLPNFQGRKQQLIDLHHSLFTEDGKVGIKTAGMYGMGGIGKTQLAVEYAHRYRFYFDKGVFWLNAAESWQAEIVRFADSLGLKPADETDTNNREGQKVVALANYLMNKEGEALLVMDNVDNPAEVLNREIGPKLTIAQFLERTHARLLITTRVRDLPPSFGRVEVSVLDSDNARAVLLDAWKPDAHGTRRTDTPNSTTLDAIAELFGRLPLPLGWMAAALRQKNTMQPEKLLENLKKQGVDETIVRLKANKVDLGTPEHYTALVSAGLNWQIAQLDNPNALELLTLMAAYGEAAIVPTTRLKLLVTFDEDDLFDPMAEATSALVRYSLVEPQAEGNAFRLHPLTRDYVARKYNASQWLSEATEELVRAYRTPQIIHAQTTERGFRAALDDLIATQRTLSSPNPVLDKLARFFTLDEYKFLPLPEGALESYIIQTVRDRAHHQHDDALRQACDAWLADRLHLRALDASRYPANPNLLRILQGHSIWVVRATVLADGRLLSWSQDGTLRLWSATGEPLTVLQGHTASVTGATALADGRLLSWSQDGTLRLWSATGEPLTVLQGHTASVTGATALADGRLLSWSEDGTLRLWSATGEPLTVLQGHTASVTGATALADGRLLSWSEDGTLRLWSATGEPLTVLQGHTASVTGATVLADGQLLSCSFDGTLRLWSAMGELLSVLQGHTGEVVSLTALADGRLLSWSLDHTLRLWSAEVEPLTILQGHTSWVNGATALADGRLLSWSLDGTLRLWSAEGKPLTVLQGHTGSVDGATTLADGRLLSWSDDKTLRLWSATGEPSSVLQGHTGIVRGAMALADGRLLSWSQDGTLRLWSTEEEPVTILSGLGHTSSIFGAMALADGRLLSWSQDGTLRLWSAAGELLTILQGHTSSIWGARALADGRLLSWSADDTLRLWSAAGEPLTVLQGHTRRVTGATVLANGRLLSWSEDKTLRLWSATGEPLTVLQGHTNSVNGARALADGRLLSWSQDGTLRLWSATGEPLTVLQGHTNSVNGAMVLADGRLLSWSGSQFGTKDHTLRLWSAAGEMLTILQGHTKTIWGARALADGRLLSWSRDSYLLWTSAGQPLGSLSDIDGRSLFQQTQQGVAYRWDFEGEHLFHWTAKGTIAALYTADAKISALAPLSETRCAIGDAAGRVLVIEAVNV